MPNTFTHYMAPEHHASWELGDMRDTAMNQRAIAEADLEAAETRGDEREIFHARVAFIIAEAKANALNVAWIEVARKARALEAMAPSERGF